MGGLKASSRMADGAVARPGSEANTMTLSEDRGRTTDAGTDACAAQAHEPPSQQGRLCGVCGRGWSGCVLEWCCGQSGDICTAGVPEWQLPPAARCAHAMGPPPTLTRVASTTKNHLARLDRIGGDRGAQTLTACCKKCNSRRARIRMPHGTRRIRPTCRPRDAASVCRYPSASSMRRR